MPVGDISKALKSRVRAILGQPSKQGVEDAWIYLHLNRAQYDLGWRLCDAAMPELTAVATGNMTASAIALPSDFWRERELYVGAEGVRARRWPVSQLDALATNVHITPSADMPFYYIWDTGAGTVKLLVDIGSPTSTAAYELFYVKCPTAMSDTSDPVWSEECCDLLVMFAVARFRESAREYQEAERVWRAYRDAIAVVNSRHEDGTLYEGTPGDA